MKLNSILVFIVVVAAIATLKVSAQPPPQPPPPTPVPIDGGVSLVIAGCVGYGLKKINDKRKAKI